MKYCRTYAIVLASVMLSGCGTILQTLSSHSESTVSADPLDLSQQNVGAEPADSANIRDKQVYLGRVLFDSEKKCDAFRDRLVLGENTISTTGDILSTTFSALATIFTPVGTSHALSGAATIVTGSKTAIDADIYAKAAISDFATAIDQTYYKQVQDYTTKLPSNSQTPPNAPPPANKGATPTVSKAAVPGSALGHSP
jgi:hypothetical protein